MKSKNQKNMDGAFRTLVGLGIGFVLLKVITSKPVKKVLLVAAIDGAYHLLKRKLK